MAEFYTVITTAGREAVARATQSGVKVDITHMAIGDGGGVPVTPNESQTQLVNECWRGSVATYSQQGSKLIIDSYIPPEEASFITREMGLYTADGVLFAVCNTPEMRKVLPSEGAVGSFVFGMELDITDIDMRYIEIHTNPIFKFLQIEVTVNTDDGATVTATLDGNTITTTAVDGNAVFNLPSYGEWTFTATLDGETAQTSLLIDTVKQYKIDLIVFKIYGVSWDGTSTTKWSRTDSAALFTDPVPAVNNGTGSSPFDGIMPWEGMQKLEDADAGTLVAIPKFYYKIWKNGKSLNLQIKYKKADGFSVSSAHRDRGDGHGERDIVYIARYHCTNGYKSLTAFPQLINQTRNQFRTGIHALNEYVWQWDFAMWRTIHMLYLVEFADWNSQKVIGYGCSANETYANNGQTDNMQYHTGTTAATRETYGFTQYRNIEGLWDTRFDYLDGCYIDDVGLNVILNPADFSDSIGGMLIGAGVDGSSAFPTEFSLPENSDLDWAFYANKINGNDSSYCPDVWNYTLNNPCIYVGGSYSQSQQQGLFAMRSNGINSPSSDTSSRVMKLPPKSA